MQEDSIFNNLTENQKKELDFLLTSFLSDNHISEKERLFLHEKAVEFGIDVTRFDEYINVRQKQSIDKVEGKRQAEQSLYGLLDIFLENNDLTEENRKYLMSKAGDIGMDPVKFNEYIEDKRNEYNRGKHNRKKNTNDNNKRVRPAAIIVPLFVIGACVLILMTVIKSPQERPIPLSTYVEHNPSFVFQTASMSKYLVLGTPDGTWERWEKLQVFQVKATADFSFDMTKLEVKKENVLDKELTLTYVSDTFFPLSVDIDIPQGDIVEIEKIDPKSITEEEAEKGAEIVSVMAGTIGTLVGGKVGSSIGGVFGKVGQWIGGGLGALAGGGAAAYKAYVWTKDKLIGLQFSPSISVSQSEEFITASKAIMAAEMLDLNLTDKSELLELRKKYQDKIEEQLQYLGERLGWTKISIEFKYPNN